MSNTYSILHISDLHRSKRDPISNDELISALVGDRDRYTQEDPKIPIPQAIVVSGDLIQGVTLDTVDYTEEIKKQYEVAEAFLDELAKRFVNGDRAKVIIIPGNHDVDWNTAFKAMKKLDSNKLPKDFKEKLFSEDGLYRWNWKDCTPYEITNLIMYEERLSLFWDFFERFYKNVKVLLRVNRGADCNLFSLFENRIGLAAFNSCHGNDCFAFHGRIPKEVVSRSFLDFKDIASFDLLISVWHHNFEGAPYRTDYMNIDSVKSMIGYGYRMGLYGHHHKAQVSPHQIYLPDQEKMAVISAGSLCAGANELPVGFTRQYNIIEIAENLKSVKVHVREMKTANLFSPHRLIDYGSKSYAELEWETPKNTGGDIINTQAKRKKEIIEEAEFAFKRNEFGKSVELLHSLELPKSSYERELFFMAAMKARNWTAIVENGIPPFSIAELTTIVESYCSLKKYDLANKALEEHANSLNFPAAQERELRQRITTLTKI